MGKHDRSRKKKNYINFTATKSSFPETCVKLCYGLPESKNLTTGIYYDMICTIIDGLIKYVKFVPCKTKLFLNFFADHGILEQIINNKNKLFTSKFNIKLRKTLKMKKKHVNSFSPPNGRPDRTNEPNIGTIFQIVHGKQQAPMG